MGPASPTQSKLLAEVALDPRVLWQPDMTRSEAPGLSAPGFVPAVL